MGGESDYFQHLTSGTYRHTLCKQLGDTSFPASPQNSAAAPGQPWPPYLPLRGCIPGHSLTVTVLEPFQEKQARGAAPITSRFVLMRLGFGCWLFFFFFFSEQWVKRDSMGASATGCEWVTAGRWEVKPHPAAVTSTPTCSFRGRKSCSGDTHLLSLPGEFSPLHHSQAPLHPATPRNPRGRCPPAAPISAVKSRC